MSATPSLSAPLRIGSSTVRNRVYRAPVLEGAARAQTRPRPTPRPSCPTPAPGVGLMAGACVSAQMLGMKGVCYNPEVTRAVALSRRTAG